MEDTPRGIPPEYHYKMGTMLISYQFLAYPIFRQANVGKLVSSILNHQNRWVVPTCTNPNEQCSTPCKNEDVVGISWNIISIQWQSPIQVEWYNPFSPILSAHDHFRQTSFSEGASDLPNHADLQLSNCHAVTGALRSRNTSATVVVVPAALEQITKVAMLNRLDLFEVTGYHLSLANFLPFDQVPQFYSQGLSCWSSPSRCCVGQRNSGATCATPQCSRMVRSSWNSWAIRKQLQ